MPPWGAYIMGGGGWGRIYYAPLLVFFKITFKQKITLLWFNLILPKNALRINLQKHFFSI